MPRIPNRSMIRGHGIDIEEISSIGRAYEKNARFAEKILTAQELARFGSLKGAGQPRKPLPRLGGPVLAQ